MLEKINKNQVVDYVHNVEVFMICHGNNPYTLKENRVYINEQGCSNRVEVNAMCIDFLKYYGAYPAFYAEVELCA